MRYEAVIFDLDGTLLNTLEDLTDAVNIALSSKAMPERTLEEVRAFVGNGIAKLIERAMPEGSLEMDVPGQKNTVFEEVLAVFKKYYGEHCQDKTAPYPGILDMLRELKAKNLKMAIVSNKADFAVKELNPVYFEGLIAIAHGENEAAGIRKKPAPDMVHQALKELDCPVEKAVYVGDSDVDIQTAKNSGMNCIGVSWGFRGREFLVENGAGIVIDHPSELLGILEK